MEFSDLCYPCLSAAKSLSCACLRCYRWLIVLNLPNKKMGAATQPGCRPFQIALRYYSSELKPAGDLDDSIQSSAADRVGLSDLPEGSTIDVEDRVAGST